MTLPYWRLSGFYFFYFSTLGALLPFWSLYLKQLGFQAQAIGTLMGVLLFTKLIGPNLWGWLADHTGQRLRLVRIGSLLAAIGFIGVFFSQSYWWLIAVMFFFSFFWNAVLPLLEALTFSHLGRDTHRYSQLRVWGSIGFIVVVVSGGWFFQQHSITWLPWLCWGLLIGLWLSCLAAPPEPTHHIVPPHSESLLGVLKQPAVLALLCVCFINQASHGVYYTFYSIYLEHHGYGINLIGQLWALGVIAEVLLFLMMHRLQVRYSLHHLFVLSIVLTAIRWLLIGYGVESLGVLIAAQLLHAASFGLYHATAIQFIHQYFRGRLQGRGQALYSSFSFGAGGGLGAYLSGYLWEYAGPTVTYSLASIICWLAVWVAWYAVKPHSDGKRDLT